TLRIVKVFWGLSAALAYRRHFPAVDWLTSYSLYTERLKEWYIENVGEDWLEYTSSLMRILQEEASLLEIVRLVGMDALSAEDRLLMETAKSIREDFLHQNAYHEVDTYASLKKQAGMMRLILDNYKLGKAALKKNIDIEDILAMKIKERVGRAKYVPEEKVETEFQAIEREMREEFVSLESGGGF
ncbi:MAG TPA: V-type ATP synthase subunit A, partial [Clostridia bacterium]|nr:V-type ATP synthase subunit A [Clostridia bacterium]